MPLANFTPPVSDDRADRKLLADVAGYGWHVIHVAADDRGPGFSYTIGLYYTFEHPELLIMGLPQQVAHDILNEAVKEIRSGKPLRAGELSDALLRTHSCKLSLIPAGQYGAYLGYAIWFYRALPHLFPALQIIWPDQQGLLPGDTGYDMRYAEMQSVR